MKDIKEIKTYFEHRSYEERVNFIDEYDFEDDYFNYYKEFIIGAKHIKDAIYLSELIDLAAWLGIFDKELYDRYFSYLFEKRHYLVKLAALDYLLDSDIFYLDDDAYKKLILAKENAAIKIVKNQALINILALTEKMEDLNLLKKSLSNTNDWRSIYRTLKQFEDSEHLSLYKNEIYSHVYSLQSEKDFGDGVRNLLLSAKLRREQ